MPSFPISSTATQVSQSITQPAMLQNTGPTTVYLSSESAVNSAAYDMRMTPGATVQWPANRNLWAVTALNDSSTISVLYNAEGAALSEVGITGTVDVRQVNPVLVQGGAELLLLNTYVVPTSGAGLFIDIPAPPSGLTYPALELRLSLENASSTKQFINWYIGTLSPEPRPYLGGSTECDYQMQSVPAVSGDLAGTVVHRFPVAMDYPYFLNLQSLGVDDALVRVELWGITAQIIASTTDLTIPLQWQGYWGRTAVAVSATTATEILLPASFTPYQISLYVGQDALLANSGYLEGGSPGTFKEVLNQPHISPAFTPPATGVLGSRSKAVFTVPGSGLAARLSLGSGGAMQTGTVYLTMQTIK